MTVLRREDVQSRVASWDGSPYRIASSPILTIVPLILRRLRGPSLSRVMVSCIHLLVVRRRALVRACWCRLERRPQEARQFARDRHRDLGRGFVVFRQASESSTQSLLRLVRDRNHTARLAFSAAPEGHPRARSMLIMPGRLDQETADQRVAHAGDAAAPLFLATGVLTRHEAYLRHQRG